MVEKLSIDEKLVRRLADLLEETGLSEIEYEAGGRRIRVARGGAAVVTAAPTPAAAETVPAVTGANGATEAPPTGSVTAPMVGTAYVAEEPGKPPFVSVGDRVAEGQTLLIIEAMKVMNQIPSPHAGVVKQILVQDGQPVEYGEPLMVID